MCACVRVWGGGGEGGRGERERDDFIDSVYIYTHEWGETDRQTEIIIWRGGGMTHVGCVISGCTLHCSGHLP